MTDNIKIPNRTEMPTDYVDFAKRLRKILYENAEPSMHEMCTKQTLIETLRNETQLEVIDCGHWFYAVWRNPLRTDESSDTSIAFRADYDAVTGSDGVSRHLCGHDGHAAILAALGKWISDQKPDQSIILLFQPGEETGEGALVCKELFKREQIREIYGLHNIPGYPAGKILLREGTFACASTGLCIEFQGAPSHAAYPENGKNPATAVAELIMDMETYLRNTSHKGILLSTVIGIDLGSGSYGVSASEGTLRLTVRAEYQEEFDMLLSHISTKIDELGRKYDLEIKCSEVERFPSTENHKDCVCRLRKLLDSTTGYEMLEEPRRWSEDFGWYLKEIPGAFVGIGAGIDWPQLHTRDYEFNDSIIEMALDFFREIILKIEV